VVSRKLKTSMGGDSLSTPLSGRRRKRRKERKVKDSGFSSKSKRRKLRKTIVNDDEDEGHERLDEKGSQELPIVHAGVESTDDVPRGAEQLPTLDEDEDRIVPRTVNAQEGLDSPVEEDLLWMTSEEEEDKTASTTGTPSNFGFFEGTFNLSAVTLQHKKAIVERGIGSESRQKARKGRRSFSQDAAEISMAFGTQGGPISVEEMWRRDLARLQIRDPEFFSSTEARMCLKEHVSRGKPAYASLPVNEFNNSDLREIFRLEYEVKQDSGGSIGSFKQLKLAAGQLLRLSVVRGDLLVGNCWKAGKLFSVVCNRGTVELLVDHYKMRTTSTTVMTKTLHLKKISEHARLHFSGRDAEMAAEAERTLRFVRSTFNAFKALGRTQATSRRVLNDRIACASIFMPEDFARARAKVKQVLDGIVLAHNEALQERGERSAAEFMQNKTLIRKWFINMLVMLVVCGGGQRPQVYTQLQVPSDDDIDEMQENSGQSGYIELRTLLEKTRRSLDMPFVILPKSMLTYTVFHVHVVRPTVLQQAGFDEEGMGNRPLLIHTETCQQLVSARVTITFKKFMERHNPDMAGITLMNLRSS